MSENIYVVYRILNTVTDKSYIGITSNFRKRKNEHLRRLRQGLHHSIKLQNAWNKYTTDAFVWAIIGKELSEEMALQAEIKWITNLDSYRNGYNMNAGGSVADGSGMNSLPCTWNGIEYPSITSAARALGINTESMRKRLLRGYKKDEDMPRNTDARPCVWNGIEYTTVAEAAEALGISTTAVGFRLKMGYTCDDDLLNLTKPKQVVWNNQTYPSVTLAAKALGIAVNTMVVRLQTGYTCDDDMVGSGTNNQKKRPCIWNGVEYPSISEAARKNGVTFSLMQSYLQRGLTCDADIK